MQEKFPNQPKYKLKQEPQVKFISDALFLDMKNIIDGSKDAASPLTPNKHKVPEKELDDDQKQKLKFYWQAKDFKYLP